MKNNLLPSLRHIEYLILKTIERKPKSREQIIRELDWRESDQYFYSQMHTMRRKEWITQEWYVYDEPFYWFLKYEITAIGIQELSNSRKFYSI